MTAFKKFALVPVDEYERMKQKQFAVDPITKSMGETQAEMDRILKRTDLGPEEQAGLYQFAKHRHTGLDKSAEQDSVDSVKELLESHDAKHAPLASKESLVDIRARHAKFASGLRQQFFAKLENALDHIDKYPEIISWNEKDEAILNGKVYPGTNIYSLVKNLYVEQRDVPHRNEFLYALASTNIPHRHISNRKVLDALNNLTATVADPDPDASLFDLPAQSGQGQCPPGIPVSHHKRKSPLGTHSKGKHPAGPLGKRPRVLHLYHI